MIPVLLAIALGFLAGAAWLWLTAWRTRLALGRGPTAAVLAAPVALLLPLALTAPVFLLQPGAAWALLPGLLLARLLLLPVFADRLEEGPWTR